MRRERGSRWVTRCVPIPMHIRCSQIASQHHPEYRPLCTLTLSSGLRDSSWKIPSAPSTDLCGLLNHQPTISLLPLIRSTYPHIPVSLSPNPPLFLPLGCPTPTADIESVRDGCTRLCVHGPAASRHHHCNMDIPAGHGTAAPSMRLGATALASARAPHTAPALSAPAC